MTVTAIELTDLQLTIEPARGGHVKVEVIQPKIYATLASLHLSRHHTRAVLAALGQALWEAEQIASEGEGNG